MSAATIAPAVIRLAHVIVDGCQPFTVTLEEVDAAAYVLAHAVEQDTPTGVYDLAPDVVTYRLGEAFAAAWRDYDGRVHLAPNGRVELVLTDEQASDLLAALNAEVTSS